ncbi:DUF3800 domain-containing protein [Arthrobacter jiangjiafuii]|uniref:DUF3800 domain-containing protein n=1 Tax=Arthrobacter jiangjiafuii TaxID=2817475 RepID=A0A975M5G2_9MICC|nr:DUF3800 domain-containing protein [Arthrobacter jiangjiafuii]MBP3044833.1 DUF3800 domain-containing protein [Arthrobacter jiangjiafuii]QWC10343.1 DUF3800 domain-containing protein [Arthrobacter jiangjiafuii]
MTISRLIYIDDSGSVDSGLIVYGWIECSPERWRYALRAILELRKSLYREHAVPPAEELHATKFINGRDRVSTRDHASRTEWKTLGRAIARDCLTVLRDCDDIRIGSVYRRTNAKGREYSLERGKVYEELLRQLNDEHRADDTYAFLSMDGDGSDPTYFNAHRSLPLDSRYIIEDPMFHDSRRSQWVQMADLVAYVVFTHLNRHDGNKFAWDWYEDYLAPRDCHLGPQEI